jgi:hypothetical protein
VSFDLATNDAAAFSALAKTAKDAAAKPGDGRAFPFA